MQRIFDKYDYDIDFTLIKREDFLASLEKQYLIQTPHPPHTWAPFPHRGRLISKCEHSFLILRIILFYKLHIDNPSQ